MRATTSMPASKIAMNVKLLMLRCHIQATDAGLSQGEAKTRLETYGPNRLPHKKRNPVLQYLGYTAAVFVPLAC